MAGVSYIPANCELVFREPFFRTEFSPNKKLYIRALVNASEREIRIDSKQQVRIMEDLIRHDGKLLNAVVKVENGKFIVLKRSPQSDFFSLVRR